MRHDTVLNMTIRVRGESPVAIAEAAQMEADAVTSTWEKTIVWAVERFCAWPGEAGIWRGDVDLVGRPV
jgi:hypothetical protein